MASEALPMLKIPTDDILEDREDVVIEIYKITCSSSTKCYVGQTVSHVLNHGKYRRYGSQKRLKAHISEATRNNKTKQCRYLNNAIRKYGEDTFSVEVIGVCILTDGDKYEIIGIEIHATLFPTGYNLKTGGKFFTHTEENKDAVSAGVKQYADKQRMIKFEGMSIPPEIDPKSIIEPLRREGVHYGWLVRYINKEEEICVRSSFGGVRCPLEESMERALEFVRYLQSKEQ